MTAAEIAAAKEAIARLALPFDDGADAAPRGRPGAAAASTCARTLRASTARPAAPSSTCKYRRPAPEGQPPIVALLDISGSMSQYTRLFLHFLHALTERAQARAHVPVRHAADQRHPRDRASAIPTRRSPPARRSVTDWSGGTRIATSLAEFNRLWSRRVLGQGAVVLLITDGLERDADDTLAFEEMERLHRSCRRLIWLNPLLRFDGFEAARPRRARRCCRMSTSFARSTISMRMGDLCASLRGARPGRGRSAAMAADRWREGDAGVTAYVLLRTGWPGSTAATMRTGRRTMLARDATSSKPPRTGSRTARMWRSPPWSRPGARRRGRSAANLVIDEEGNFLGSVSGGCVEGAVVTEAHRRDRQRQAEDAGIRRRRRDRLAGRPVLRRHASRLCRRSG